MNDTSVIDVSPQRMRNVVRIDAAAVSSGVMAKNDPKTSASTTRAPTPPTMVSTRTLTPPPPPAFRASTPVTATDVVADVDSFATCCKAGRLVT